jgi:hypothetical protein
MVRASRLFLLSLPLIGIAFTGCGGGSNSTALPVPLGVTSGVSAASGAAVQPGSQVRGTAAVAAIPAGTYWSGTVSGISKNGITANCGQSNFAAGYGCLPVTTTGAAVSGSPVAGQYFQMWGDFSKLPQITATTINYSSTPFPATAPTPAPVVATASPTPAAASSAMPTGSYWSGTVSAVNGDSITANCGQSNFAAGYGCLPVNFAGATVSGTPVVGQYFQMWGDLSKLPKITATTINFAAVKYPTVAPTPAPVSAPTASPEPVKTIAPTPTPTPTPTPIPAAPVSAFTNGAPWPATFVPYGANSVWNKPLPAAPKYASNSAQVMSVMFPGAGTGHIVRNQEAGPFDYGHPIYFASASDPVINVVCGTCSTGMPNTIHIPANAQPAQGTDGHLAVVQPDMTEIDFYCGWSSCANHTALWKNGDTIAAGYSANVGSFISGSGMANIGTTALNSAAGAGLLNPVELAGGHINHALFVVVDCVVGAVYPAPSGSSTVACSGGVGAPLGGVLYYDVPDSVTEANTALRPWEKAMLEAAHDHGWIVGDHAGVSGQTVYPSGVAFMAESAEPQALYGGVDPWAALASQGWTSAQLSGAKTLRWTGADPWTPSGVNLNAHLHLLDACVAAGSC